MQRKLFTGAIAGALAMPAFAGDRPAPGADIENVLTMRVEGDIAVDETGKVLSHTIDTKIDSRFGDVIERAVAQWRFAPPTVGGKSASVRSAMRVTLVGRQVDAGTEVTIDNVLFYDREHDAVRTDATNMKRAQMRVVEMPRKPAYPNDYHVNGVMTLAVRANPDGTIAEVFPTQCSLYQAGGSRATFSRACKKLADIAIPSIRTWKLGIELNGDAPTPENLTATLPLEYSMKGDAERIHKAGEPGNWRMEARTVYTPAPWMVESKLAQRVGTSDVSGSEMIPQEAPLQLLDDAPRAL